MAGRDQRMADHRVADLDAFNAGADRLDPAGILVAHNVGKLDVHLGAPDAFDHMQVGAADARAADLDDHIRRAGDFGIGHIFVSDKLFGRQRFVECVEHCRFHGSSQNALVCGPLETGTLPKRTARAMPTVYLIDIVYLFFEMV